MGAVQEHQSLVDDADAPQHFFRDLAAQNDAAESSFDGSLPTSALPGLPLAGMRRHLDFESDHCTKMTRALDPTQSICVASAAQRSSWWDDGNCQP